MPPGCSSRSSSGAASPCPVSGPAQAHCTRAADLDRQQRRLLAVVAGLGEARLGETVAGKDCLVAVELHGVAQHLAYHAGQVALLRKLVAG